MRTRRVHVFVSGGVQGVSFRWHCRERARREGVAGWVRNVSDGRVEAVFEGDDGAVDRMLRWCETGPPAASVEDVAATEEAPLGLDEGFRIVT